MSDSEHVPDYQVTEIPESGLSDSGGEEGGSQPSGDGGGNWKAVLVILMLVFAGLGGLAFYASQWKQAVAVREVVIEGTDIVRRSDLSSLLQSYIGKNLQSIDTGELEEKLLGIPYVKGISVARELNGIIRVRVTEREPVARTVYRNKKLIIDAQGMLLPETQRVVSRYPELIRVFGIRRTVQARNGLGQLSVGDSAMVMDLTAALKDSEYAKLLIREIHLEEDGLIFCKVTGSPARFVVGSDGNFKEKLKKFEIFWQKVVSKKGLDAFYSVDLRFRDRVFTRDIDTTGIQRDMAL
ncbi:MAG: FtsQ-type POTRA domain-containing protein [Chlorobium sp.]|jgi:cell division protein FtsQ|uniref:cell division protein FtsQ/DivIB n=1 Tax=Chlorobium sp. TaxID=1095 RepID=UPI0025C17927|nr:FtsQ-type POTRA domain-containing protein [Chlorobium sp.]MCF8216303.1 FtsQ-type POTRA domain-containing protein [Chlorobium sp.]MCF8271205.1 FtsQ-type POTRA domain-containing protein [Chlorobium sp.]MCF8287579.1 FtsQ-type POTRA domain-containing protein [Chlorobium sp.]MCF8291118.1 FtsQ-type POTRA domain-containing protein [Chlorobium sp.]MCF8385245.1 FtsQ-type POTRA domain-containing protein [Chlorobium sp.]